MKKLDASIPANNQKIIELYPKMLKEALLPNPAYQRKLVWRKQHKFDFIDTILKNYPFPEIYIAPGELNVDSIVLKEQIVDGQQRLNTIKNYIEGKDVFSLNKIPIPKFKELQTTEKEDFLNYEVSVRYLKNATTEQIIEIFKRINSTEYALNKTERLHAQWGDSEFILFAKQIIEEKLEVNSDLIAYKIDPNDRNAFINFFIKKYSIFTENDLNRMLALQYIMTLIATLVLEEYFRRNDQVQMLIEKYFEEFKDASTVEFQLHNAINFIDALGLNKKSYWFNKANIFSLITECYKYDVSAINKKTFAEALLNMEENYKLYITAKPGDKIKIPRSDLKYFEFAKEAVNEKTTRDFRGNLIRRLLKKSVIKSTAKSSKG